MASQSVIWHRRLFLCFKLLSKTACPCFNSEPYLQLIILIFCLLCSAFLLRARATLPVETFSLSPVKQTQTGRNLRRPYLKMKLPFAFPGAFARLWRIFASPRSPICPVRHLFAFFHNYFFMHRFPHVAVKAIASGPRIFQYPVSSCLCWLCIRRHVVLFLIFIIAC